MLKPARPPVTAPVPGRKRSRKPQPAPSGDRAARETILLVDDERPIREFLSRTLDKAGYRVLAAADGESALSLSEKFAGFIHLLVTDVMMPVMNGKDLADRLCSLRPDIKVLFMSGYSRSDFWPDVCEDQTDWLPKPFTASQFHRKVRYMLDSVEES